MLGDVRSVSAIRGAVGDHQERVRDYDFAALPVTAQTQASLAALFAARCTPDRWSRHASSRTAWAAIRRFADFLSQQQLIMDTVGQPVRICCRHAFLARLQRARAGTMTATAGTRTEPRAGDRTISSAFCDACRYETEAGEGVCTRGNGRLGARHAGDCPPPLTIREIAAAAVIGRVQQPLAVHIV